MTASALRSIATVPGDEQQPKQQIVLSPTSPTSENVENVLLPEIDPKMLLLGDLAENSSWWMGGRPRRHESKDAKDPGPRREKSPLRSKSVVSTRSPRIEWGAVAEWYHLIQHVGENWRETWKNLKSATEQKEGQTEVSVDLNLIDKEITEARIHAQKTLLKATENLLKRPRRPLRRPEFARFLLILLANPELNPPSGSTPVSANLPVPGTVPDGQKSVPNFSRPHGAGEKKSIPTRSPSGSLGHHSGIVKRILGLLGNLPNECHHYLVGWFARLSKSQFETYVGLVGRFVTYRLSKQHHGRQRSGSVQPVNGLVPSFPGGIESSPAHLHAVLHDSRPPGLANDDSNNRNRRIRYNTEDWQIRAAARVMALLFAANNQAKNPVNKRDALLPKDYNAATAPLISQYRRSSMTLPLNQFYNSLLDYSDLVADFEAWEARTAKFSFCQYPFFLSIAAKSRILEHDARRQMTIKAREAFLDSILNHKDVSQYLNLKVRRDCLIEDSLRGVSEVVGAGSEDIKKSLRIEFIGEEGVDAGGLRKEWFLLLVREVFDPNHGLFVYDEDSQFCYFNPFCFESSEQFFLVGVLLGLAIYNSTILDIALPPFAFKKLLAAAPSTSIPAAAQKPPRASSLDDLTEYRPALAKGLRALLDFDGDVQETFCYDFVAQVDRYGQHDRVPLCPNGEKKPVTNANRQEFVSLYVQYLLDTAVQRQFEPFKRGFYTVCGGNALALFRPEEIELMVRGSDEPLDVPTLRAVATYENWPAIKTTTTTTTTTKDSQTNKVPDIESSSKEQPPDTEPSEPVITWFWDFFGRSTPSNQRKLLSFVTGSDRIPATGAASLSIRLACLGEDCERFPIAHTCFNKLGLFRYGSRQKLEGKLGDAICNSEGFGLK
jgi:E3 ubiquitin-protein ligase HECTD2